MESAEQRSSKKKLGAVVGLVIILAGGAWFAYTQGLIPGLGGSKVAEELKAEIEALKGPNLKAKIDTFYTQNAEATPEEINAFKQSLDSVTMDFQYAELKTSSGDGKGTVEIISPKVDMTSLDKSEPGSISVSKLVVSRSVSDPKHYFFHTEGDVEFYGLANGVNTKIFAISGEQPYNEIKFGKNKGDGYFKSTAKNLRFLSGQGNVVLATITESNVEATQTTSADGKVDSSAKVLYKDIIPGDMIKMMVGDIQPISFNFDYTYKGDNIQKELQAFASQQAGGEKMKSFDGDLKLNNFSLMMGDAGFAANADLKFSAATSEPIPTGTAVLKVNQYQKLIDYAKLFAPVPQQEIDKQIAFLSEVGTNENGNITFNLEIDGANRNVKVNGKTTDEIELLHSKYFPRVEGDVTGIPEQPAVEATPLPPTDGKVTSGTAGDINASNSPDAPAPKTETPKAK